MTGTKGKTTTSHAIYHILQKSGKDPILVGVGRMPVLDRLRMLRKNSVVVFELSSWRLSGLPYVKMSPHIGVFTNFSRSPQLLPHHGWISCRQEEHFCFSQRGGLACV